MGLPNNYKWLEKETGPKMLIEALKLYGTKEMPGDKDNPEILEWAKETGLDRVYSADEIPWCGLFMAVIAKRAGKDVPENPLWARNWAKFGQKVAKGGLGDVLVFRRGNGGHVGLYIGEDKTSFHVLGGNQSNAVIITRILKTRLLAIRRPNWKISQPESVRSIELNAVGIISTNEA